MSLPIPQAVLIQGATRLATNVASRVSQAMGFEEILRGGDTDTKDTAAQVDSTAEKPLLPPGSESDAVAPSLIQQITGRIRQLLHAAGIDPNPVGDLRVEKGGLIRTSGEHPRSAEIERLLNADPGLVAQTELLSRLNRGETTSIGLTNSHELENIKGPGGYPNW